nr:hypothetical protein [Streptomyces guryensis]
MDLTYRPLADAPQSQAALALLEDRTTDLVEEFIGVVRGRTVNSSRGNTAAAAANTAVKKPAGRKPAPQQGGQRQGGGRSKPTAKKAARKRGKPRRRS